MDEIRRRIDERLKELGRSQSWLSAQLGRNRSYVFQYLIHGSPRDLDYADKLKVAELLKMEHRELGILPTTSVGGIASTGLREDAEPYIPDEGHFFARGGHFAYFRMKSDALDEAGIKPGQLLVFDINQVDVERIETGRIVVAQLYDKRDLTRSHGTIIRIFMAPNKLVTNSSGQNQIIRIDDPDLPWEPVIKGVMRSAVEDFN